MKRALATAVLILAATAATTQAAPVYGTSALGELSGIRDQDDFDKGGNYATDTLSISWVIQDLGGGSWSYAYTFTGFGPPGISHFILDLTDEKLNDPDIVTGETATGGVTLDTALGTFSGANPSNPGMAGTITGIKFNTTSTPTDEFTVSFNSNQAPVYGDIYVKGGSDSYVNNLGLVSGNHDSDDIQYFVARPDGNSVVPEPSSIALIGIGLLGLAGHQVRRRRARA